jgi:hypothetical protein
MNDSQAALRARLRSSSLSRLRSSRRRASLPEAPSGFGLENGFQGYFQRFAGLFGAGTRLARQDLGYHLGNALILLHKLAFP